MRAARLPGRFRRRRSAVARCQAGFCCLPCCSLLARGRTPGSGFASIYGRAVTAGPLRGTEFLKSLLSSNVCHASAGEYAAEINLLWVPACAGMTWKAGRTRTSGTSKARITRRVESGYLRTASRALQTDSRTASTYFSSENGLMMYDFKATTGSP